MNLSQLAKELNLSISSVSKALRDSHRKLLKRKNRPDGIFASVEKLAIATYEICRELKLTIPQDVKVICFSNSHTVSLLNPSLTTITQPAYEMGEEAATILFKLIEKRRHHFLLENTIVNSKLIARNSTKAKHNRHTNVL